LRKKRRENRRRKFVFILFISSLLSSPIFSTPKPTPLTELLSYKKYTQAAVLKVGKKGEKGRERKRDEIGKKKRRTRRRG
jgi:hypothetical protein